MATTSTTLAAGVWTSLGTTPCSVQNRGFGDLRLAVDTSPPGALTAASVIVKTGETADIGVTGQNAYGLPADASASLSVVVVR